MRIWIILVSIIYTGCGTESKNNSSPAVNEVASPSPITPRLNQTSAFLVKTGQELPSCGSQNPSQLIYVVETSQFMTCEGQDWLPIDVRGKDGTNGRDGVDGDPGEDLTSENEWVDPMSDRVVAIGGQVQGAVVACPSGFRLPSDGAEGQMLALHGLVDKLGRLGVNKQFWWKIASPGFNAWYIDGADLNYYSKQETVAGGFKTLVCIKD